ncbi:MAG: hypothetical protein PUP91_09520 [Rhizonema sp. PD37]|nr:hypothetical protein [Rhizonema sp. PD37]
MSILLAGLEESSNQSKSKVTTMKLESSAFTANGLIRAKYTCDGENIF